MCGPNEPPFYVCRALFTLIWAKADKIYDIELCDHAFAHRQSCVLVLNHKCSLIWIQQRAHYHDLGDRARVSCLFLRPRREHNPIPSASPPRADLRLSWSLFYGRHRRPSPMVAKRPFSQSKVWLAMHMAATYSLSLYPLVSVACDAQTIRIKHTGGIKRVFVRSIMF